MVDYAISMEKNKIILMKYLENRIIMSIFAEQ